MEGGPLNRCPFDQGCHRVQIVGMGFEPETHGFERHAATAGGRVENDGSVHRVFRQPTLVRMLRCIAERTRVAIGICSQPLALPIRDSNALLGRDRIPMNSKHM